MVASHIPEIDPNTKILLLLGRDIVRLHKVWQQISGPHNAPFTQRSDLGWVVVGDVCLGNAHKTNVSVFKTNVLENGRPSNLKPWESFTKIKENVCRGGEQRDGYSCAGPTWRGFQNRLVKVCSKQRKMTTSWLRPLKIQSFLKIMDTGIYRDEMKSWVAPLPFRVPRQPLLNNREHVLNRLISLCHTLVRKLKMKQQFIDFMAKIF